MDVESGEYPKLDCNLNSMLARSITLVVHHYHIRPSLFPPKATDLVVVEPNNANAEYKCKPKLPEIYLDFSAVRNSLCVLHQQQSKPLTDVLTLTKTCKDASSPT